MLLDSSLWINIYICLNICICIHLLEVHRRRIFLYLQTPALRGAVQIPENSIWDRYIQEGEDIFSFVTETTFSRRPTENKERVLNTNIFR